MRHAFIASTALLLALFAGCATTKKDATAPSAAALDVGPTPAMAYQPAPMPAPQPVAAEPALTQTPVMATGAVATGNSYTVKKGDTLYGIAKAHYGDGKQWQKIVSANPGVAPGKLKVGQSLVLP